MILPTILTLILAGPAQDPSTSGGQERWFTVTPGSDNVSATALQLVQEQMASAVVELQRDFPDLPKRKFRVFLHDSRSEMQPAMRALHHEGSPGFALLARHEIHLIHSEVQGNGRGFWPVVLHELTHEFLEQHAGPGGRWLPRWFHEGLAQVVAQDTYLGASEDSLVYRLAARRLFPFRSIAETFPDDPTERQAAYAQSYSFVSWLERKYGRPLLLRCATLVDRDNSIERALVLETGRNTEELLQGWRDYLMHGSGARWRVVLDQWFSLSLILALPLLALAVIRALRRDARARQAMTEAPRAQSSELQGPPLPPPPQVFPDPQDL